jgi:hypothetical protein
MPFMDLEIVNFIRNRPDFREALASEPYAIRIKESSDCILLKYTQHKSDFMIPLVRECRGIILDKANDYAPVCVPFFKFGNAGEAYVPEIDWNSAVVWEKIDGSLIKLWHHRGDWHISSNGEIDARNAVVSNALIKQAGKHSLFDLFMSAWENTGCSFGALDTNYTYMFELASPLNRLVIPYDETFVRHIGSRNMATLQEEEIDIGVAKPQRFPLNSIEACLAAATAMGVDGEGFVVVDADYNRVKIKSPTYVLYSNAIQGLISTEKAIETVIRGEDAELLAYFPEYADVFREIHEAIGAFIATVSEDMDEIRTGAFATRKELAAMVTKRKFPACVFALLDGKSGSPSQWLFERSPSQIARILGK